MAVRKVVELTAGEALDVSLDRKFEVCEVVVLDTAATVVIYAAFGVDAEQDLDDSFVVVGGVGAFNDKIYAPSGTTTVSLYATADCKVQVGRVR
jgi:hypothetical protein